MPELPEVQTVLDTLESRIKDCKIIDIKILYKPIVETEEKIFKEKLINQHFRAFKRRGKYLLFEMDDITLVSHLRMEGKYFILDDDVPLNKHDHVIFYLDNGKQLRYNDVRKFGRMELIEKDEDYHDFKNLGVEPFGKHFTVDYCRSYLENCKLPIKQVLLDQSFIAGIGNIYADEICYAIRINPKTLACKLDDDDYRNLIAETKKILRQAIKAGGTTIRSYTSSLGVSGRFQQSLKVHTMSLCPSCEGNIRKITVGGRGTYYCPNCQKWKNHKIALTGTIGSGKTTACDYLRKKGYEVFDCDEANRDLLKRNKAGYKAVKENFPECFEKGILDKKKLSDVVFGDRKKKELLESLLHPLILDELMKKDSDPLVAEVPLLFEVKWNRYFDESLLICTDEDKAVVRLEERGFSHKEAKKRIANQMPVDEKIKRADKIIYNNGSLEELYSSIDKWIDDTLC